MHKTMKTKLNTLPPTIKISTGFTDVMCMNTRVGSVICKLADVCHPLRTHQCY